MDPDRTCRQALFHLKQGELEPAARLLRDLIREQEPSAEALYLMGLVARAAGRHAQAADFMSRAILSDPSRDVYFMGLAGVLMALGGFMDAAGCCQKAIELDPGRIESRITLAMALLAAGKHSKARDAFAETVPVAGDDPRALLTLGRAMLNAGEAAAAAGVLEKALEKSPEQADLLQAYGKALRKSGEAEAAVAALEKAVAVDGNHAGAFVDLGNVLRSLSRMPEAEAAYEKALAIDPDNTAVSHVLSAMKGENTPAAPDGYVRRLFDASASSYDRHMLKNLEYRLPEVVTRAVDRLCENGRRFTGALDLGCGTGLLGKALSGAAEKVIGLDLSPAMIRLADKTGFYDELVEGEIVAFLAATDEPFDLAAAADVLIYIGDLKPFFTALANRAVSGAAVVCTTEDGPDTEMEGGWRLSSTGRFQHCPAYVRSAAEEAGFTVCEQRLEKLRKEGGQWVSGHLHVLSAG